MNYRCFLNQQAGIICNNSMGGLAFLHRIHLTVNATNRIDKISVLNDMSFLVESCWLHFALWAMERWPARPGDNVRFRKGAL